ncbi:MAG: hypothetical protein ACM3Q4_12670 [Acidobacteriota bacterium]
MLTAFKKNQDRHIAVILERSHVTAVELTHTMKGYVVNAAGSFESQTNFENQSSLSDRGARTREKSFAGELGSFLKKIGAESKKLSFGLNTSMLMLQSIPMDSSLDQTGRMHQALWELRHFDSDATETSHALIAHELSPDERSKRETARSVIVGVRRNLMTFLEHTASHLSAAFAILDVQHFCAENAFTANYPAAREQRSLVIGMDDHGLTSSTLVAGQTVDVQVRSFTGDDLRIIHDAARDSHADAVYLHGSAASYQMCESMKQSLEIPVELIDPFRVVMVPASLKGLADIKARRHEFTAAVGLAMRTE